jgi:excisionase family DNA binding protein
MQSRNTETDQSDKRVLGKPHDPVDSACLTLSIDDAAKVLGISRGSAYTLAGSGELPTIRLGRRLLVPRHALDKLIGLAR